MYLTDFEYADKRLSDMGYIVCHINTDSGLRDVDIGCDITFNTVKNNHSSVQYITSSSYDNVYTTSFDIVKNTCNIDREYIYLTSEEVRRLTTWLNRREYRKVKFISKIDSGSICYYGSFNVKQIMNGNQILGLSLTFTSNAPYGFGEQIKNEVDMDYNEVTASGEFIHIDDCAKTKIIGFSTQGNTKQKTTEGKNLWDKEFASDVNNWILNDDNPYYKRVAVYVGKGNNVTLSYPTPPTGLENLYVCITLEDSYLSTYKTWLYNKNNDSLINTCVTLNASMDDYIYIWCLKDGIENGNFMQYIGENLQIEYGTVATDFEEYTGRMASPNMEYQQYVINAGQRLVEGNQLFDASQWTTNTVGGVTVTNNGDGSFTIHTEDESSIESVGAIVNYTLSHEDTINLIREGEIFFDCKNVATNPYCFVQLKSSDGVLMELGNYGTGISSDVITREMLEDASVQLKVAMYYSATIGIPFTNNTTIKPMLYQDGDGTWEPYTGGVKKVVNIGRIEGKVLTRNMFDIAEITPSMPYKIYEGLSITKDITISCKKSNDLTITTPVWRVKAKYKDGQILYVYDDGLGYEAENFPRTFQATMNNPIIELVFRGDLITVGKYYDIQCEFGSVTNYTPYSEQSFTITSDRPITKWDKLIEQDGQIGWGYRGIKLIIDENSPLAKYDSYNYNGFQCNGILPKKMRRRDGFCNQFIVINQSESDSGLNYTSNSIWLGVDSDTIYFVINDFYDASLEDYGVANFKAHLNENPLEIWTYTDEVEFVPLPQEEQEAIRNLMMYHPITNISNDQGINMEVTYLQDYDNEFVICGDSDEFGCLYPNVSITFKQDCDEFKIMNTTTSTTLVLRNCKNNETITIDGEHKIILTDNSEHKQTLYNDFNYEYLDIQVADDDFSENKYEVSSPCTISIKYSPIRKVGVY